MTQKVVKVSFGDAAGHDCYIFHYPFTLVDPQPLLESENPDDHTRMAIAMLYKEAQRANDNKPITGPVLFNDHSAGHLTLVPIRSSDISYIGLSNEPYSGRCDIKHVSIEVDMATLHAFLEAGNRDLLARCTLKDKGVLELATACPQLAVQPASALQ